MNFLNSFSIRAKTYLLVGLSVVVALVLSFVSNNGMRIVNNEVREVILVSNIQRDTYRALLEEKNYLLNANGSVVNYTLAKEASDNADRAIRGILRTLDQLEHSSADSHDDVKEHAQEIRKSIESYEALAQRGVFLLD